MSGMSGYNGVVVVVVLVVVVNNCVVVRLMKGLLDAGWSVTTWGNGWAVVALLTVGVCLISASVGLCCDRVDTTGSIPSWRTGWSFPPSPTPSKPPEELATWCKTEERSCFLIADNSSSDGGLLGGKVDDIARLAVSLGPGPWPIGLVSRDLALVLNLCPCANLKVKRISFVLQTRKKEMSYMWDADRASRTVAHKINILGKLGPLLFRLQWPFWQWHVHMDDVNMVK